MNNRSRRYFLRMMFPSYVIRERPTPCRAAGKKSPPPPLYAATKNARNETTTTTPLILYVVVASTSSSVSSIEKLKRAFRKLLPISTLSIKRRKRRRKSFPIVASNVIETVTVNVSNHEKRANRVHHQRAEKNHRK